MAAAGTQERLNALSGYRSDGRMAGEGNPCNPAQARMQVSIHEQSGGARVGPKGARSSLNALSDIT